MNNTKEHDDILLQCTRTHLREGRLPQAQLLVAAWLERAPAAATPLALQAQMQIMGGNLQSAIADAQKAVALDAYNPHAAFALAQTFLAQNRPDQAEPNLERAHHLAPKDPDISCALAQIHLDKQQPQLAIELLRRATSAETAHPTATLLLAEILLNNDPGAAEEVFRLTQAVCSATPHMAAAWVISGLALGALGDTAAAHERLQIALWLEPDQPAYMLALAQFTVQDPNSTPAQLENARATAQRATALASQDWRAPWLLARLLRRQHNLSAAIKTLAQASQAFAQEADLWLELSHCCAEAGQAKAAQDALDKARAIAPDAPALLHATLQLQQRQGEWAKALQTQEALDQATRGNERRLEAPVPENALAGKTLAVLANQLSDHLLYGRYLALAHQTTGASICLATIPSAACLLNGLAGVNEVVTTGSVSAHWIEPISRLPLLIGAQGAAPLWNGPYLQPNAAALAHAKQMRAAHSGPCLVLDLGEHPHPTLLRQLGYWASQNQALLVALSGATSWRSSASQATLVEADSADLDMCAAWAAIADITVCHDTHLAHLAGAMGLAAQVLLPLGHDPLWGMHASISPWYPTLTLLREPVTSGWDAAWLALDKTLNAIEPQLGTGSADKSSTDAEMYVR